MSQLDILDLSILKILISNKKYALDFIQEYDTKLFSPEAWSFANVVIRYLKAYAEVPTLKILLDKEKNENLKNIIRTVWQTVDNFSYDEKEYKYDLEKIKKRFADKEILKLKETIDKLHPGSIDTNKVLTDIKKTAQNITALDASRTYDSRLVKEHLVSFVEKFNAKKNDPELDRGVMTGYAYLDFATNGLKAADYLLIAGESGHGKSQFLLNLAIQIWLQNNVPGTNEFSKGNNVIYFSLEMPYEDCFNRLLSRLSGVPYRRIENAKLSAEEFTRVKQCLDFINRYGHQFRIVDIPSASANDLEAIMLETGEKYDAVFADYLGIMRPNEKMEESDWLSQSIISFELRAIARKYALPMFSAVQLNRKGGAVKDPSEAIGLNRLARSAGIATHATHVLQIESRNMEEKHSDLIYHIIKNRKGPKGKGVLIKNFACATLLNKEGETVDQFEDYNFDQDDILDQIEDLEL